MATPQQLTIHPTQTPALKAEELIFPKEAMRDKKPCFLLPC